MGARTLASLALVVALCHAYPSQNKPLSDRGLLGQLWQQNTTASNSALLKLDPVVLQQESRGSLPRRGEHYVSQSVSHGDGVCKSGQRLLPDGCQDCAPGTALLSQGLHSYETCSECTPGKFQNQWGGYTCLDCPIGQYAPQPGAPICIDCPAGTCGSERGSHECRSCNSGIDFQHLTGQSSCELCGSEPEGLSQRCGIEAIPTCLADGWACQCKDISSYFKDGKCLKCTSCALHDEVVPCQGEQNSRCGRAAIALLSTPPTLTTMRGVFWGFGLAAAVVGLVAKLISLLMDPAPYVSTDPRKIGDCKSVGVLKEVSFDEVKVAAEFIGGWMTGWESAPNNYASEITANIQFSDSSPMSQIIRSKWGGVRLQLLKAYEVLPPETCCTEEDLPKFWKNMECVTEATIEAIQATPKLASKAPFGKFLHFLVEKFSAMGPLEMTKLILKDPARKTNMKQSTAVWHETRWSVSESGHLLGQVISGHN